MSTERESSNSIDSAENEVFLAGYTDKLSARPGESIRVFVSCLSSQTNNNPVRARLVRSICADPNPAVIGGIQEEDASAYFTTHQQSFPSRHQPLRRGSHAQTKGSLKLPAVDAVCVRIDVWIYPTCLFMLKKKEEKKKSSIASEPQNSSKQVVWSWGELSLSITADANLQVEFEGVPLLTTTTTDFVLREKKWYKASLALLPDTITSGISSSETKCELKVWKQDNHNEAVSCCYAITSSCLLGPKNTFLPHIDAPFCLATGGTFNGKLEAPTITIQQQQRKNEQTTTQEEKTLVSWDFSRQISDFVVPCNVRKSDDDEDGMDMILYNHPTRGVTGRLWDGSEPCWKHAPEHYAAIAFHDDDLYDVGWDCDLEWNIPHDTPSGIYILRLSVKDDKDDAKEHEEALPIFVCAPMQAPRDGKICILVSTFTYVMYGNHARADFDPSCWLDRMQSWKGAYPHNPSQYPKYGWSTYNFHTDGTGISFASHRRPLFNMRPGYITFGNTTQYCSGLRHFPADSHLIAWMHHNGYDYDIVTDHDLNRDGVAAIQGYSTLITGSHPEYHTLQSLNALQSFRDHEHGGNIIYLGGNGFYWRIAAASNEQDANLLEIRRAEAGVRTWASEPGEYYHQLDGGSYGGLWRRNGRPPQQLVGVGFSAQGLFVGRPYQRVCFDPRMDWVFSGISQDDHGDDDATRIVLLGDFGYSGGGAAGFEWDRVDRSLDKDDHEIVVLAQAHDVDARAMMLVPEEVLTTYSTTAGLVPDEARRADMVYFETALGAKVFAAGSITFCGSLLWNNCDNNISTIVKNVIERFTANEEKLP